MSILTFVSILALLFSAMITALICRIGYGINLLDKPNIRSSHLVPTPRGGGVGILSAFFVVGLLFTKEYAFVLICVTAGIIGLLADLSSISSLARLVLHILISAIFVTVSMRIANLSLNITTILTALFFIIFLTGSANIYNFMDGINGIAGMMAVVSFGLLTAFSIGEYRGVSPMTILTIAIIFSSLGFLWFNVPNARIFMGDVGSIFLGFIFAGMVILLSKSVLDFICLASFLFTFYADEIITMYFRIKNNENLLAPHRRHLYQILANEGKIAHWKVSCGYALIQLIIGITILSLRPLGPWLVLPALFLYFAFFVAFNISIRRKLEPVKIIK